MMELCKYERVIDYVGDLSRSLLFALRGLSECYRPITWSVQIYC